MSRLAHRAAVEALARAMVVSDRVTPVVRARVARWRRSRVPTPGAGDEPRVAYGTILAWRCHVCGHERPDHLIAVLSGWVDVESGRTRLAPPRELGGWMQANVRFCADRTACRRGATGVLRGWLTRVGT